MKNRGEKLKDLQPAFDESPLVSASCQHPAAARKGRGGSVVSKRERTIQTRRDLIFAFDTLRRSGWTAYRAARELRTSEPSIWRWRRRIEPLVHLCGRKSIIKKLCVPHGAIQAVQWLQASGMGAAKAFREFANDPRCPPALAEYLRRTANIPPSLLRAVRVRKRKATILECESFTLVKR
jgi:hypothetical protein